MLIKWVCEIDPLCCPKCQGQMKVVAYIESPQGAVIKRILRHCGLLIPSTPRAPPPEDGWVYEPDAGWDSVYNGRLGNSRPLHWRKSRTMGKILILYHSATGNTAKMAALVAEGAESVARMDVRLRDVAAAMTGGI